MTRFEDRRMTPSPYQVKMQALIVLQDGESLYPERPALTVGVDDEGGGPYLVLS